MSGSLPQWRAAIVTGAASGIGRSFAQTLAAQGTAVGLLDVSADALAETGAPLRTDRAAVETAVADVSAVDQTTVAVQQLASRLGGIDLLIHCAAILGAGHFAQQPAEAFDRVVRVGLLGTANVVRAALPVLRRPGAVACLASTAAVHGWPALSAYSSAKCGVSGFCDAVRSEVARDGITVTAVFPLLIDTPLLRGADLPPILRGRRLPPEQVVAKTLAAITRGQARVFIPGSVRVIAALHGLAPGLLDWYGRRFGLPRS